MALVGCVDIIKQPVRIVRTGLAHKGPKFRRPGRGLAIAKFRLVQNGDARHAIIG